MKVSAITLGCKVNQYESQAMLAALENAGYTVTESQEESDVILINSCTVTATSDHKVRQMLRRARRKAPTAVIVLTGCMTQAFPEMAEELVEADIVLGNSNRRRLPEILREFYSGRRRIVAIEPHKADEAFESMQVEHFFERTRAFIKIEDGCNRFCSYCIIPYARGRVRSKPLEELRDELRRLGENGYKEVVLTGINLSAYGQELGLHLCDAVEAACAVPQILRVRLGSLEPEQLSEEVILRLAKQKKLCPQFHLSLQSGCDETLKRMNRHYTTEEYYDKVKLLRRVFGNPAITTDVITGFPGETEEEFAVTRRFLEKVDFFEMHVFKYSRRQGTVAASMENQVPEAVKAVRSGELLELEKRQSAAYREGYIGKEITILTEEAREINGERYRIGHTDTYVKAAVPDEKAEGNMLVAGKAVKLLTEEILLLES